ncbi:hypothetical protein B0O99DRAFT_629379 [Bisporella sp. PMI_857]|nr:hypothetical protein B0O99DRAFT_629379 [Bisporella sp. PMI_857]
MADPLTALGLASNIVQIITFTSDLISKGREIYKSADGTLVENLELETITTSLQGLSKELVLPIYERRKLTKTENQLQELCDGCKAVSGQLLDVIRGVKAKGPHMRWNSFRQALNSVYKEDEIQALETRLDRYRRQIDTTLLISLRDSIQKLASSNQRNQQVSSLVLGSNQEVKQWQAELINALHRNNWQLGNKQDLALFSTQLSASTKDERENLGKSQILETLHFHCMGDRFEGIAAAHRKTFDWMLVDEDDPSEPDLTPSGLSNGGEIREVAMSPKEKWKTREDTKNDDKNRQWSNFVRWLHDDSTLYWVTGKPGSGKSTLMKYLHTDCRTLEHLRRWSGELPLVTGGFFFWNSGTTMQMSKLGLLQTLLHDAIKDHSELVPTLFPHRWRSHKLFGGDLHPWSMTELVQAFKILISDTSKRFFFFIDGLDEFDGDGAELANFILETLSSRTNVKMCVASRPWLVFEDAFQRQPSLRLEDLTAPDIRLFVTEKLSGNGMFVEIQKLHPNDAKQLVVEVTEKASGVFLWVHLVVASLLEGLRDGDSIADLQDRLLLLPSDLENLFLKILNQLNPSYFEQASRLFQLVRAASEPLSLLSLSLAEEGFEKAMSSEVKPMPVNEISFRVEAMRRRLNSRCKGLLEAPTLEVDGSEAKVQYLHRTVRDYLHRTDTWEYIISGTKNSFDADLALSAAFLLHIKIMATDPGMLEPFWNSLRLCVQYSIRFAGKAKGVYISVLDELEEVGLKGGTRSFFDYAFEYPLYSYIQYRLDKGYPPGSRIGGDSLLFIAVFTMDIKMMKILFGHRADPNICEGHTNWTPWHHMLWKTKDAKRAAADLKILADAVQLFLENGADLRITVDNIPANSIIKEAFQEWDRERTKELLKRLPSLKKTQEWDREKTEELLKKLPSLKETQKTQKIHSCGLGYFFKWCGENNQK